MASAFELADRCEEHETLLETCAGWKHYASTKVEHVVAEHITYSPFRFGSRGVLMVSTQEGVVINIYVPENVEPELRKAVR